jgi:hypothetical protein
MEPVQAAGPVSNTAATLRHSSSSQANLKVSEHSTDDSGSIFEGGPAAIDNAEGLPAAAIAEEPNQWDSQRGGTQLLNLETISDKHSRVRTWLSANRVLLRWLAVCHAH